MNFDINDFVRSLRDDRHDDVTPSIPDQLLDYSDVIAPLSVITRHGRALHSDNEYSFAEFISTLLHEYLGEDHDSENLQRCIAGLSILLVTVMRSIATIAPDWRAEELLLDCASQSAIRECMDILRATPATQTSERLTPNFSQLPLFQRPIPMTQEALQGFITRRIAPYFSMLDDDDLGIDQEDDTQTTSKGTRKVNLNDLEPLEADPLNDFNEFYREFFKNEDEYLPDTDVSDSGENNDDF